MSEPPVTDADPTSRRPGQPDWPVRPTAPLARRAGEERRGTTPGRCRSARRLRQPRTIISIVLPLAPV